MAGRRRETIIDGYFAENNDRLGIYYKLSLSKPQGALMAYSGENGDVEWMYNGAEQSITIHKFKDNQTFTLTFHEKMKRPSIPKTAKRIQVAAVGRTKDKRYTVVTGGNQNERRADLPTSFGDDRAIIVKFRAKDDVSAIPVFLDLNESFERLYQIIKKHKEYTKDALEQRSDVSQSETPAPIPNDPPKGKGRKDPGRSAPTQSAPSGREGPKNTGRSASTQSTPPGAPPGRGGTTRPPRNPVQRTGGTTYTPPSASTPLGSGRRTTKYSATLVGDEMIPKRSTVEVWKTVHGMYGGSKQDEYQGMPRIIWMTNDGGDGGDMWTKLYRSKDMTFYKPKDESPRMYMYTPQPKILYVRNNPTISVNGQRIKFTLTSRSTGLVQVSDDVVVFAQWFKSTGRHGITNVLLSQRFSS